MQEVGRLFFQFTGKYGQTLRKQARVMNAEELSNDFRAENFTNHVLPVGWQRLKIEGLTFSYGGNGGAKQLSDVSMELARGERVACVGTTGSGKTTFLKVLRDLYHPQQINLSVDGVSVPEGFGGIARAISLIPQEFEVFIATMRANITLGADYSEEEIERYMEMACFTEVADMLPNRLESAVDEKGVNLSGGQRQRLALARGLLASKDKDMVLLDEPSAALDKATEMQVYRNILSGFAGKTIVASIHGLHLLPLFDTIYVFEGGRIVGSGTLDELVRDCRPFIRLWEASKALAANPLRDLWPTISS